MSFQMNTKRTLEGTLPFLNKQCVDAITKVD
jgi:hypothetical protein